MIDLLLGLVKNEVSIQKEQFDQILTRIKNIHELVSVVKLETKKRFKFISQNDVTQSIRQFIPDSVWKK